MMDAVARRSAAWGWRLPGELRRKRHAHAVVSVDADGKGRPGTASSRRNRTASGSDALFEEMTESFDSSQSRMRSGRGAFVVLLMVLGATSIAGFVQYTQASANSQARVVFKTEANLVSHSVELAMRDHVTATRVMKTYMDNSNTTASREGFRAYAETLLQTVPATAYQYIPAVRGAETRARMEAEAAAYFNERLGTNRSFPFRGMSPEGLAISPEQDLYFPVTFVEPVENNEAAINLNILSLDPKRKAGVYQSIDTGKMATFGPLQIVQEQDAFAASIIVQAPLEHREAIVVCVVRVPELIERVLNELPAGLELHMFGGESNAYYGGFQGSPLRTMPEHTLDDVMSRRFAGVESFEILNKNWTIVVCSNDAFLPVDVATMMAPAVLLAVLFLGLAALSLRMMRRESQYSHNKALLIADQARKEALAVTRAERHMNDFLAHEVRNPLTVAISAQRFLRSSLQEATWADSTAATASERDVELIGSSLTFILELVSNMLDLNKFLEQQEVALNPTTASLNEDVLQPVKSMLGRENTAVVVEVEVDEGDVWVEVDSLRLKQVIMNLAKNAIKFVETGFVRLSAHRVSPSSVVIAVEDSGPGVPVNKQPHLFAKYQESLDKMHQGTGIGLCLSKLIVDSMGGSIALDPDFTSGIPGCPGARFVVELPLVAIAPPIHGADESVHLESSSAQEFFQGSTFLVVDDDPGVRAILSRSLTRLFPEVSVKMASSAEGAFEVLAEVGYANVGVIFMDQYMPGPGSPMTGVEAIQRLRAEGFDGVILGCSANDVRAMHMTAGADGFMRKPIPGDAGLSRVVRCATAMRRVRSVLIVDDERVNLLVLERLMRSVITSPCRVDTELSGEAGLDLAMVRSFDLIILDENMSGGMRGSEAAQALRLQGCKAMLVSLSGGRPEDLGAAASLFDAIWEKPLPPVDTVRSRLVELVLKSSKRGTSTAASDDLAAAAAAAAAAEGGAGGSSVEIVVDSAVSSSSI